ncbi:hypothetical protein HPB51_009570 [Rhipicephalus microplus]|uniref:Uncharacterized protein n=1 Tax=Rhipicephalus microplus TaxID=6941 RepID=A0A9J6D924_RHIMP|nr:hypothetical protein HPB51_009570 [Rhipicephalus microplus]
MSLSSGPSPLDAKVLLRRAVAQSNKTGCPVRKRPFLSPWCGKVTLLRFALGRSGMVSFARFCPKRAETRLFPRLTMGPFYYGEQVLSWICKNGAEALSKHFFVADSLSAIQDQEYEFEKFYFLAMRRVGRRRPIEFLGRVSPPAEFLADQRDQNEWTTIDERVRGNRDGPSVATQRWQSRR